MKASDLVNILNHLIENYDDQTITINVPDENGAVDFYEIEDAIKIDSQDESGQPDKDMTVFDLAYKVYPLFSVDYDEDEED